MKIKYFIFLLIPIIAVLIIFKFKKNQSQYELTLPQRGPIVEAVYGMGTVTASQIFNLRTAVSAGVRELYVQEGQLVQKNNPLVQFDDGAIVRAPFEGTVTAIHFKIGENVFPQSTVLTLVNLKKLYLSVSLEQQGAMRVERGQDVEMSFESLRGQKLKGKVRTIFPQEGQFIVHVDVELLPAEILPGMTADLAIAVGKRENALLIPVLSISSGKAILKRNDKEIKEDVKIGIVDGNWAEVISGNIKDDDYLVVPKKK